jgi:hypothetical protein
LADEAHNRGNQRRYGGDQGGDDCCVHVFLEPSKTLRGRVLLVARRVWLQKCVEHFVRGKRGRNNPNGVSP